MNENDSALIGDITFDNTPLFEKVEKLKEYSEKVRDIMKRANGEFDKIIEYMEFVDGRTKDINSRIEQFKPFNLT